MATMTAKQQSSYNKFMDYATMHGRYEVKDLRIENYDFCSDVYVCAEIGMKNDENTLAECICRSCYSFNIGSKGGVYYFDKNNDYEKRYISCYEIEKARLF